MNVKELKEILKKLPEDMEVIQTRCSDYATMTKDDFYLVKAVDSGGGWLMRSHPTMTDENKAKEKTYFHIDGN